MSPAEKKEGGKKNRNDDGGVAVGLRGGQINGRRQSRQTRAWRDRQPRSARRRRLACAGSTSAGQACPPVIGIDLTFDLLSPCFDGRGDWGHACTTLYPLIDHARCNERRLRQGVRGVVKCHQKSHHSATAAQRRVPVKRTAFILNTFVGISFNFFSVNFLFKTWILATEGLF